jgi:hypothetical protein
VARYEGTKLRQQLQLHCASALTCMHGGSSRGVSESAVGVVSGSGNVRVSRRVRCGPVGLKAASA